MLRLFRILFDPNSEPGQAGGSVPPENIDPQRSVNPPPAGELAVGNHTDIPIENPPAGDNLPPSEPPPEIKDDPFMITKLPKRDTPEYSEAFSNLSVDEQFRVEEELSRLNRGSDPELLEAYNNKYGENAKPPEPPPTEDKDKGAPGDDDEVTVITKDIFEKLDPAVQKTVSAMDAEIKTLRESQLTPEQRAGFELALKDPEINKRLEALQGVSENPSRAKEFMKIYDPNEHVDVEALAKLDFKNDYEGSLKQLSEVLKQAAQKGYDIAEANISLSRKVYEKQVGLKVEIEKQLNEMVVKTPSMKSEHAFTHPDHPLAKFFGWVTDKGLDAERLANLGVEHVFMMFQSQTGGLKNVIDKQVIDAKKKIFMDLESMEDTARSLSRNSQTQHNDQHGQMYKGIDLNRYRSEPEYRSRMYESADYKTQLELEKFVVRRGSYVPTD